MKPLRVLPLVILVCCAVRTDAQDGRIKVITGVTLIDGTTRPPVENATIVIEGARISQVGARGLVSVPSGATVIDGRGKFVIPGLADMHNHLQDGSMSFQQLLRGNLRRLLAVGVTTVFDPSISLRDLATLKSAASEDSSPYARFFATGPIITVKGDFFGQLVGSPTPETPSDAQAAVKQLAAAGVDAIKAQVDDASWSVKQGFPMLKLDVLAAVVNEAHQQKLKVFVHAPMLRAAKDALRAGVDGMMHGIIDEPVDAEFIDLMKRNGASYVPTMGLFHDIADSAAFAKRQAPLWDSAAMQPARIYEFFASPAGEKQFQSTFTNLEFTKQHLPVQRANVKRLFDGGVPVVLGTDTGFFGVLLGVATHLELELLVDAGLKPEDALRAATINAARMIGREKDLGSIEAGKLADLVILDANPLADIRNTTRIYRTIKGGAVYEPVDPAKPVGASLR